MSDWFDSYGFADVYDGLVIGAQPLDADDVRRLASMSIRRVLNLVQDEEYPPGQRGAVALALDAAEIEEQRVRLVDFGGLPADELEAAISLLLDWLEQPDAVYVHCRAGWQRSAAVAAGAIAVREGIEIDEALARVRRRKPSADPLPHQREDLRRWLATRAAAPAVDSA